MRKIYFLILATLLVACKKEQEPVIAEKSEIPEVKNCMCPPVVWLQPCNSFTENEAKKLAPVIEKAIEENTGLEFYVGVRNNIKLPKSLYNENKSRYRALKILNYLRDTFDVSHDGIIALTHNDISDSKDNIKDFGIEGLAYIGKRVAVASDFRIKNKTQFWKVIIHEFLHSFCDLKHCKNNDSSCLMREGAMRKSQIKLCKDCKQKIYL